MSFKNILVHLAAAETDGPALRAAAVLARQHQARLTGLHAYSLDWALLAATGEYINPHTLDAILAEGRRTAANKAAQIQAQFERVLLEEAVPGAWRSVEGAVEVVLVQQARLADLAVFGLGAAGGMEAELAETVLFQSGQPVLLVPQAPSRPFDPRRILVGWSNTRESARAIRDALPLLRQAEAVRVLSIATEADAMEPASAQAEAMARHLALHGVKASGAAGPAQSGAVQDALLNASADFGAGLLVIGGYGHGRLREMVLGGVTRSLFRGATLPVLLSH
ncbi:universal stress protein [Teichococcus oryzae]|nr:universal stress protein [Pseudoroseomonas oryzae]